MSRGNMLSLCQIKEKIKNLNDIDKRSCDTVYLYHENLDMYFTIDDIRIDSENDIVIDIKGVME